MRNFMIATAFLLAACSAKKPFTNAERRVICSQQGRIMRLYTISDHEDSLFLRQHARALNVDELASDYFQFLKQGMLLTVRDSIHEGVGIAAPQVGVSRRLIAVQRFDKPSEPFGLMVKKRPEIRGKIV